MKKNGKKHIMILKMPRKDLNSYSQEDCKSFFLDLSLLYPGNTAIITASSGRICSFAQQMCKELAFNHFTEESFLSLEDSSISVENFLTEPYRKMPDVSLSVIYAEIKEYIYNMWIDQFDNYLLLLNGSNSEIIHSAILSVPIQDMKSNFIEVDDWKLSLWEMRGNSETTSELSIVCKGINLEFDNILTSLRRNKSTILSIIR